MKRLPGYWRSFKKWWQEWWSLTRILAATFLVLGLLGEIFGLYQDISANFIAIGITVLIIDTANEHRANQQFKQDLIYRMGSRVRDEAVRATEELARRGWLDDGSLVSELFYHANLQGADLTWADLESSQFDFANLEDADLSETYLKKASFLYGNLKNANLSSAYAGVADFDEATLEGADLTEADLEEAIFESAILRGARLIKSNLRKAKLHKTDLRDADLSDADLREALLIGADLRGANLVRANVEGVNFYDVKLNRATILPNGIKWRANIDMNRYGAVIVPVEVTVERRYGLKLTEKKKREIERQHKFVRQCLLFVLWCVFIFGLRKS